MHRPGVKIRQLSMDNAGGSVGIRTTRKSGVGRAEMEMTTHSTILAHNAL